jgi:ATP-dependent RNA helicase DeaD
LQRYAKHLPGFHVLPVYGGQSMVVQLRQLSRGTHVIVGTPGRVMDHLERRSLVLDQLRFMVLDEADEMLRMGFIDDVTWILEHTPATRQTALFSATMPEPIRRVAHRYLREPKEIKIRAATTTTVNTQQFYCQAQGAKKLEALTRILEIEADFDAAIIFVRTKIATVELADKLEARGYAAAALNGDMTQGLREQVIERLKSGSLDIVVATDVAARGIDVSRVSHVINYDMPNDTEAYVHRIGRTGRAGRSGRAVVFVAPREMHMLKVIERATRQKIEPLPLPTPSQIASHRIDQLTRQIREALDNEPLDFFFEVVRKMETEQGIGAREIAAALTWLIQRDRPLQPVGADAVELTAPRPERDHDKPARENREQILDKRRTFASGKLARYRIEIGRNQGVLPKEIVGAIANEAGIDGKQIGQINLFDDYSTVELPADLPHDVMDTLRRIRVRQVPLKTRLSQDGEFTESRPARPSRSSPSRSSPSRSAPPRSAAPRAKKPWDDKPAGGRGRGGKHAR